MKTIITFGLTVALLFVFATNNNKIYCQDALLKLEKSKSDNFFDIRSASNEYWNTIPVDQRRGWKQYKRWEHFWESRVMPDGSFPDITNIYKSLLQSNQSKNDDRLMAVTPQWKIIGPVGNPKSSPNDLGVGRINVVRVNPKKQNIIWIGAASGGVWKSENFGSTWTVFPYTQFLSLGVSDIAFAPTNPDIAYVATGDADAMNGNGASYSIGVLKTTDAGATWQVTNLNYVITSQKFVTRLLIHPNDPNNVIAATSDGIYKTTDGGNTWTSKVSGFFKDMEFKPDDPQIVYASTYSYSGSSVYKSSNNGETWKVVKTVSGSLRISLAVTIANTLNVYGLCSNTQSYFHSFIKSDDQGDTWQVVSDINSSPNILGRGMGVGNDRTVGQGFYDLCLAVSPGDENEVYAGGINIWKSTNGGSSWNLNTHWTGGYNAPFVHADQHDLFFDENQGNLYSGNDGGIDYSTDGGSNWINLNGNLAIMQFYRISGAATDAGIIYGGSQDNGTSMLYRSEWQKVYGGDGMDCAVDNTNPLRAYISIYNGMFFKTGNGSTFGLMLSTKENGGPVTGEGGAWVTPFALDPQATNNLYAGYLNVWESSNYGASWNKLTALGNGSSLLSLAVAPSDSKTIYAANSYKVWATYDGGQTWITIPNVPGNISYIAVDPKNPKRFWLTNAGFSDKQKVYEYNGTTMKNLSGNLPNIPVNAIAYQKDSPDRLYIGTDLGVYVSDYGSANWQLYGAGLPNVIVNDIEIQYNTKKLRAGTYGRGVWETDISVCNLPEPPVNITGNTEFCQGDSLTLESVNDYPSYSWSTGETTKKIIVRNSGAYSLTISDVSGCTVSSQAVFVNVNTVPQLAITPSGKYPVCEGDSVNVDLSAPPVGFIKYNWSTGETTKKIKVNQIGKYTVSAMTKDSCIAYASINIVYTPKPTKPVILRYNYNTLIADYPAVTFQWFYNGRLIPGATKMTYKPDSLGIHTLQVTDANGCTNISDPYDIVSGVTDLSFEYYFTVKPNPGTGIYYIDIAARELAGNAIEIKLSNIIGENILEISDKIPGDKYSRTIDIENMPPGVYLLTVSSGNKTWYEKLIKN